MKNKFLFLIFFFVFSSFLPFNQIESYSSNNDFVVNSKNKIVTNNEVENGTLIYNSIINYADLLIEYANKSTNGWSWKRVFNFNDNYGFAGLSQFYPGYYFGAAGTGDLFIRIYELTKNNSYLTVAQKASDFIFSQSFELMPDYPIDNTSYIHWTRAIDSSTIYTGLKYGYAGISKFLLNLYQNTNNVSYLNLAERSLDSLIYYGRTDSSGRDYWGYNIWSKSGLTGYTYGTAGIGEIFLDTYKITGKQTYLNIAISSVDWIMNLTRKYETGSNQLFVVNASATRGWDKNISGLYTGSAGVGNYYLKLYQATQNESYLNYSLAIIRWLSAVMDDGFWHYGAVDFLTEIDIEQGYFYGLSAGSAGIGIYFLNLFKVTNDTSLLYPVNRIYNALSSNAKSDDNGVYWTAQKNGYWNNRIYTGIGFGIAGIGKFFASILDNFGDYENTTVSKLFGINNYFKSITNTTTGLIPHVIPYENGIVQYRSDFFDGLTGIVDFYIDTFYALNKSEPIYIPTILESASTIQTTDIIFTSTNETVPTSNFVFISPFFIFFMTSVLILTVHNRRRKNTQ